MAIARLGEAMLLHAVPSSVSLVPMVASAFFLMAVMFVLPDPNAVRLAMLMAAPLIRAVMVPSVSPVFRMIDGPAPLLVEAMVIVAMSPGCISP